MERRQDSASGWLPSRYSVRFDPKAELIKDLIDIIESCRLRMVSQRIDVIALRNTYRSLLTMFWPLSIIMLYRFSKTRRFSSNWFQKKIYFPSPTSLSMDMQQKRMCFQNRHSPASLFCDRIRRTRTFCEHAYNIIRPLLSAGCWKPCIGPP